MNYWYIYFTFGIGAFSNLLSACQLAQLKLTQFECNPFNSTKNESGVFEGTYLSTNPFIFALI